MPVRQVSTSPGVSPRMFISVESWETAGGESFKKNSRFAEGYSISIGSEATRDGRKSSNNDSKYSNKLGDAVH